MIHAFSTFLRTTFTALLVVIVAGCSTNPVTGGSSVSMMSASQERQIGRQNYAPMQQKEGGALTRHRQIENYVNRVGQKIAVHADRQFDWEFVVINNGSANAWALPGGKIAINRGLLTELGSEAELAAVLGHEIVHAAAGHGAQSMGRAQLLNIGLILAGVAAHDSEYRELAQLGAGVGAALVSSKYGRNAEYEADKYGIKYMSRAGYDTHAAVDLQQTFVRLKQGKGASGFSKLFASHPPSQSRVKANAAETLKYPKGGILGKNEYRKMVAPLVREKPAFKLYDEGIHAYKKRNFKLAEAKANAAIRALPVEGSFYTLKGASLEQMNNPQAAISQYSEAIKRSKTYFQPFMMRGQLYAKMGRRAEARRDLEAAYRLFPAEEIKKMIQAVR